MGLGFEGLKGDKGQKGEQGPPGVSGPFVELTGSSEMAGPPGETGEKGDRVIEFYILINLIRHVDISVIREFVRFRATWDWTVKKENQE